MNQIAKFLQEYFNHTCITLPWSCGTQFYIYLVKQTKDLFLLIVYKIFESTRFGGVPRVRLFKMSHRFEYP